MCQADAYRMTKIGIHTPQATGITVYLKDGGNLEIAQQIVAHTRPLAPRASTTGAVTRSASTGLSDLRRWDTGQPTPCPNQW